MKFGPQDRFRVRAKSCGLQPGIDWNNLNQLDLELLPIATQLDFTQWANSQGLAALFLHGSTGRGGARPDSDL